MGVASAKMASATTAVVFHTHSGKTGPTHHQHQAGTQRSNVAVAVCVTEASYIERHTYRENTIPWATCECGPTGMPVHVYKSYVCVELLPEAGSRATAL